jgi:hypothetical protein
MEPRVSFFRRLRKIAKKVPISSCLSVRPSVCPHGTIRLQPHGFSWNLVFEYLSKMFRENSSLSKLWEEQRVRYMKTNIHLGSYLAEFFLEWDKSQTKVVEKIRAHLLFSVIFSIQNFCRLWGNVEKYVFAARQATDDSIGHAHYKHTVKYVIRIAFALQQRLQERSSMFRCTYISCFAVSCSPPLSPVLSHMDLVYTVISYFLKMCNLVGIVTRSRTGRPRFRGSFRDR